MKLNYEYTKEADGSYTIHNVEVLQLGRWRGRGTGPDGMAFGDAEAQAILNADAEVRGSTSIRPVLKTKHRNPLTGEDGEIVGFLDPFKRAGDRITATIRGISEAVFEQIRQGKTGWLSPDIVPDWINGVSNTTHKLFMRAVSFTGGSLPAMQSMLPLASADFDSATLEREIQLETLIGVTQDAGEPDAAVSFGDKPKEEAKPVEEPPAEPQKEVTMAEEITAQALQEKEKAFAEQQAKWEKEREDQRVEMRKARLETAWEGIVGKTATPAEEKAFMEVGMELSDAGLKAHIDSYKSRPALNLNTSGKSKGTAGKEEETQVPEKSFEERVIEKAEALAEKSGMSFTDAVCAVEMSFTDDEKAERLQWYEDNVTTRVGAKK